MNVLIIGGGKGSWDVRGHQLGAAIGARVTSFPTLSDWQWADLCVLVKNHGAKFADQAHAANVPIVWDAVDFWHQPMDNSADETRAKMLLNARIAAIRPVLTIGATQAMADACDGVYLPHHSRPGLTPTPAREHVSTVAYEGNPIYLGLWRQELEYQCSRRGWSFVINPVDLREADIVVALRDGVWDGFMCREWKSGVKIVNAMAAGRPLILQGSAAYRELLPEALTISYVEMVSQALDFWTPHYQRVDATRQPYIADLSLENVSRRYLAILQSVEARCFA